MVEILRCVQDDRGRGMALIILLAMGGSGGACAYEYEGGEQ